MPNVHHSADSHPTEATPTSTPSVLLRIFWMLAGYIILVLCALSIATSQRNGLFSVLDPVFWVVAGLMIGARYLDITRYAGATSDGQPATLAHWRRYAVVVIIVASVTWLGAHAVVYYG